MVMTAKTTRRQQVSYALHLQQQTAAVVDLSGCHCRLPPERCTTTPREHACSQRQLRQRVRGAVQDISNKVGAVHFRQA